MRDLFDKMVLPILLYGCEIWGCTDNDDIDKVHRTFCKYILKVGKSTPTCMLYGDLGRLSLDFNITCRLLTYWAKILMMDESKFNKILYKLAMKMRYKTDIRFDWIELVESKLIICCKRNLWNSQCVMNIQSFKNSIKKTLKRIFINSWENDVYSCGKGLNYRIIKINFGLEKYLLILPDILKYKFTKFRMSNHRLPIEQGRYDHIERGDRICSVCGLFGDEYHYLFECLNFHDARITHLPRPFHFGCSTDQYFSLFNDAGKNRLIKLAKFIKIVMDQYVIAGL